MTIALLIGEPLEKAFPCVSWVSPTEQNSLPGKHFKGEYVNKAMLLFHKLLASLEVFSRLLLLGYGPSARPKSDLPTQPSSDKNG